MLKGLITSILLAGILSLWAASVLSYDQPREGKIANYKDEKRISFTFYGKVVDLDGNPIDDAQINFRINYMPLISTKLYDMKEVIVTSNRQGLFVIEENGFELELDRINKLGYEYRFQYNPKRNFSFRKDEKKAELGQLPDQPIVFKIRKKSLPTLILGANARFGLQPSGKPAFFDLLWQQWAFPERLLVMNSTYKGWMPDLKIYLEGDRKNCRLVVEAIDADTGMIEDRRELFEAPLSGYKPKVVIPIQRFEMGDGIKTFVYVKGRGGKFYTRMDVDIFVGAYSDPEKRFAELDINYRTNPNGGRRLEVDKEQGIKHSEDVSAGRVRPYGYDPNAKGLSIEDVRKLLGK